MHVTYDLRTISHINITFQDYLSLIPSIRSTFAPPFIGKTTQHMRNNYGDLTDLNNNGNKNVQLASFRILHVAELSDGSQAIVPFIVILLQTYAAWFAQSPESVVGLSDTSVFAIPLKVYVRHLNFGSVVSFFKSDGFCNTQAKPS